jgi:heme exporter protein D
MLLAFALGYLGMLALCLAMPRHHKALLGGEPGRARQRGLRLAAASCCGLALGLCSLRQGGEIGALLWLCQLMLAALLLVALLAWRPRWALPAAAPLLVAGGLGWLL